MFSNKMVEREVSPGSPMLLEHNKHVYLFIFRSNYYTNIYILLLTERVAAILFHYFLKERINEVIKPTGRPSAVIYYIYLAYL